MGKILQYTCTQCGYHTELFTGGGLRDCYPDTALSAVPDNAALKEALRSGAQFQISRRPAVCRSCRKLTAAACVTYQPTAMYNIRKQNALAVCSDCGGALEWLPPNTAEVSCPMCGQPTALIPVGHWD